MASNTHDPATVDTVARAIYESDHYAGAWADARDAIREDYRANAVAALDCLTELGWRPGLTEQERDALSMALAEMPTIGFDEYRQAIEALLAGGRHG